MNLIPYLQKIGLTEKEAKLYLAGLQTGPASLQNLVSASKLKRATVYNIIEDLKGKGLIKTLLKGKQKLYLVADPENLESTIRQKQTVFDSVLNQLRALQNSAGKKPSVRIYQGLEGLIEIYDDLLRRCDEHLEVVSPKLPKIITDYWNEKHIPCRIKKGHRVRIIAPDIPFYQAWQKKDKYSLREIRLLPLNKFPFQNEIYLYHGKVGFITHDQDNSLGLVVQSDEIFTTMQIILENLWNSIPLITRQNTSTPAPV